jgi:hypothetical protein
MGRRPCHLILRRREVEVEVEVEGKVEVEVEVPGKVEVEVEVDVRRRETGDWGPVRPVTRRPSSVI